MLLRAAGTNCDQEAAHAWELAGARPERVHIRALASEPQRLKQFQILTIPGGFSYGDDISAGRIFAAQLARHLGDALRQFVERGGLVLGICNGFQVLVKAGMLPWLATDAATAANSRRQAARTVAAGEAAAAAAGVALADPPAAAALRTCTITYNEPAGFQDRWVSLSADSATRCAFLEPGRSYEMPIAHGEGRVLFSSAAELQRAAAGGHIALRYRAAIHADTAAQGPPNPNGSAADIAGLCDESGRVLGLMPHPERFVVATQHPCWTARGMRGAGDGLALFRRGVAQFA